MYSSSFSQPLEPRWQVRGVGGGGSFLHFDELGQYDFNNTGRNVLQQQSKTPARGGSWNKDLLDRTVPYRAAKCSFGQRKVLIF